MNDMLKDMTKDIVIELRILNNCLIRIADAVAPQPDGRIFDAGTAFRVYAGNNGFGLRAINKPDPVKFAELRGIDDPAGELRQNTEQFVAGLPCNNALLFGPRGTGKSSAVKACLNEYADKGLRMIEMPRDTLLHIIELAELLKERPERFIIFCDDLSFEEDEKAYRRIKTVLEGGLEARPANMLIYATSNRRHLMPDRTTDTLPVLSEGELHPAETVEEKMSLSDRFGLRLGFLHFDMDTYLDIVFNYVRLRKMRIKKEEIRRGAIQWSLAHGSFSGRTARQFVDDLEGRLKLGK